MCCRSATLGNQIGWLNRKGCYPHSLLLALGRGARYEDPTKGRDQRRGVQPRATFGYPHLFPFGQETMGKDSLLGRPWASARSVQRAGTSISHRDICSPYESVPDAVRARPPAGGGGWLPAPFPQGEFPGGGVPAPSGSIRGGNWCVRLNSRRIRLMRLAACCQLSSSSS
jgi:hypothetical protein